VGRWLLPWNWRTVPHMDTTLNYAIGAVLFLGLLAGALAFAVF
jgi:hypothetical protein